MRTATATRRGPFWLQYGSSSILYLKFSPDGRGGVEVKGPLGAASYIARTMPAAEARAYWRERVAEGWHEIGADDAPGYHAHEAHTYGL